VDWAGIAIAAVTLAAAIVGIIAITKRGINMDRRPRNRGRIRGAEGEYQPPDSPEGRYWG
jgi:hypothetical protein